MRFELPSWGRFRHWAVGLAAVTWLALLGVGFSLLMRSEVKAGVPARAPETWPASAHAPRVPGRPTLLVFAHPRCACTRATLRNLERVVARTGGRATITVILALPHDAPANWARSPLAEAAHAIPGVTVLVDRDELEAKRFGTRTSGQALLYDASGHLRFAGGLTPGRAHEGDNAGSDAVVALIGGNAPVVASTAVFGCGLESPESCAPVQPGSP